jgi:hypothetical protein
MDCRRAVKLRRVKLEWVGHCLYPLMFGAGYHTFATVSRIT